MGGIEGSGDLENCSISIYNLQTKSTPERKVGLSPNLFVGIGATWQFRIAKLFRLDIEKKVREKVQ